MPCTCGEFTCICLYVCKCRPQICFCQACIDLRGTQQQGMVESPSKKNHGQNKSRSRKKLAQSDPSNEQISSLVNDSPPGQSQIVQSLASVFEERKQTLGSTPATETLKPSQNDDPYPTIRKQLNEPSPHSNYEPHAKLRRQGSQPAPPSNYDPHSTLKRQLSEPLQNPISPEILSEIISSIFHENPSSTGGSSLSSVSNKNPYLPSTCKTGSSTAPSTSGLNKDFKSGNSTNSISKNVPATSSDSNSSCANIEDIKKASDKALPTYESFNSHFTTPSSDENNNRNFGSTISTSHNQDARQTSTDQTGHTAEIHTPLYLETSVASSASCSIPGSHSLHFPDPLPLQLSSQEHPLNLSLSADDKQKNTILHSSELSTRSSSPVPTKQRRDTMEFSNITCEGDNQSAESFSGGSSGTFSTRQIPLSSDSTAEGSYPKTRSESTSTSESSAYTSCIIQNPSQYTVITEQFVSPMETGVLNENLTSCPTSDPPTSVFFAPPQISHSSQNPYLKHNEVCSQLVENTSSTDRQSVIVCPSSRLPSEPTSAFSACQATNQVNMPSQAQGHQESSSSFPPSMNQSEVMHLASQTSNETQTTPQASDSFQPISSDVNMVPASSIAPSTESIESHARSREPLSHRSQSSTLQSASSGISPSQSTTRYRDDETGKNYANRSKRKLSK